MQPQYKQSGPHTAQRGTSLIEILVVLVILVIGILSIVRLFPAGFIALRNAENNTFADRLAQGALEQLKKSGNGLPDAIYMYTSDLGFNPNVAPGDLFSYVPDASGANTSHDLGVLYDPANPNSAYNNINKQRYISNETISVPAPHVISGTAYPPLYVLNYGPIYLPKDTSQFSTYLPVNSTPWTPQTGDSRTNPSDPSRSIDNPTDTLQTGQQKYLVDYNAGAIAVPQATYPQTFYVQVTRQNEAPQPPALVTVPATVISPASGYNGNWFNSTDTVVGASSLPTSTTTNPWVSVTLYRPFHSMGIYAPGSGTTASTTFDSDPYEFALDATNMGTNSNTGVLAFNPLAAGQNGSQPLKARISYITLDWHILHEDQNVSAGSPSIRLTLNHLKKIGDAQFDQTIYNGLITDATTPADIIILNLDTGAVIPLSTSNVQNVDDSTGAAAGAGVYNVSYQNGRITFPDGSAAQHLRFYYAGDADWALAIQKAPISYLLTDVTRIKQTGKTSGLTPNQYFIDTANETQVYFPICDAGKTVEFDGISYTANGKAQPTIGEGTAAISTNYAANGLPYVNLSGSGLNAAGILPNDPTTKMSVTPSGLTFQAVRGISAQATVIWHERTGWRTRTIDTLLTQTQ